MGSFRLAGIAQSFLQVEISADIDIPSSRLDSGHQLVFAIEKIKVEITYSIVASSNAHYYLRN